MKIAISAQANDIDALVDPRFGRAKWFIVVDAAGEWTALDNSVNVDAAGGAGVQAGTLVVEQGAQAVITGNVGPNAHKVLVAAGVSAYQASNGQSVRDALAALERGELQTLTAPSVGGHWA